MLDYAVISVLPLTPKKECALMRRVPGSLTQQSDMKATFGGEGISDAFYCFECTRMEKDRDGCPKIVNLGSSRTDLFYQKKSFRNQQWGS